MNENNETLDTNETTETPKTTETPETDQIDTSTLEIPKMGYGKDFEDKLITFIKRGTFRSKPTSMESENIDEKLLDVNGTVQRWYGVLDREYQRIMADGTKIKVSAIQLSKTQNDRLSALGTTEIPIDKLFVEGKKAKLVNCKVQKIDSQNKYWTLLTVNQYRERFNKEPLE